MARSRSGHFVLALALLPVAVARTAPLLPGLERTPQAVVGVVAAGAVLWIASSLPLGVIGILVLALLGTVPGLSAGAAFAGFASPVIFFLVGALALGTAVERSGLAERAAALLIAGAGARPNRLYLQLLLGMPLLALVVPSAITRNAVLIPAYEAALGRMGLGRGSRAGRALMLALGVLHPLASSIYVTGGTASMTAATLMGGVSWLRWFSLTAVPYLAILLGGGVLLRGMVGRFEDSRATPFRAARRQPLAAAEVRTLLVVAAVSILWLTDAVHGLSPAIPALLGAAFLLLPGIGVVSWSEFERRISWGLVLTVGVSLSLARALVETGASAWMATLATRALGRLSDAPVMVVVVLVVLVTVAHLGITNLPACVALLIPVAVSIGKVAGLEPVVCGLIVVITTDAVIFYPVQTATNLIAYEAGYFGVQDVRRLGALVLLLTVGVVVGIALPYWGWLGLVTASR